MVRKRKLSIDLSLSLSLPPQTPSPSPPPSPPSSQTLLVPPPPPPQFHLPSSIPSSKPKPHSASTLKGSIRAPRRSPRQTSHSKNNTNSTITPPHQWATNQPCHIHTLEYLYSKGLLTISGEVQCKKCSAKQTMILDLPIKFKEVSSFIMANRGRMHDRAPKEWMVPETPIGDCGCGPNYLKPVLPENKDDINWLFLLLGKMLGFCTLEQLKYFCMRTGNHRTGAKDRVLYLTYLSLCKQLDPKGPFDR